MNERENLSPIVNKQDAAAGAPPPCARDRTSIHPSTACIRARRVYRVRAMKDRERGSSDEPGVPGEAGSTAGDETGELLPDSRRDGQGRTRRRRPRTFWHYPYAALIARRKPPSWETVIEMILSHTARWADLLLLRRVHPGAPTPAPDSGARVMRGLWRLLTDVALLEFKGPTSGVRRFDLARLLSYGWEYLSKPDSRNACA